MPGIMIDPLNTGSVLRNLECPSVHFPDRYYYASGVVEAYRIVYSFSGLHNWLRHIKKPLFTLVHIYSSQKDLWDKIRKLTGTLEEDPPTDGLSAALIDDHLLAVTPEVYKQLRPEYNYDISSWQKLLAHEMIHELHIRIAGDEAKMGPRWFYEGFAMYGSGQHLGIELSTIEEARSAMQSKSRGSYAQYAAAFGFFIKRFGLELLLERAGDEDFEEWLLKG